MKSLFIVLAIFIFSSCGLVKTYNLIYRSTNGFNTVEVGYIDGEYFIYSEEGTRTIDKSYEVVLFVNDSRVDSFFTNYGTWKSTNEFSNAVVNRFSDKIKQYESCKM